MSTGFVSTQCLDLQSIRLILQCLTAIGVMAALVGKLLGLYFNLCMQRGDLGFNLRHAATVNAECVLYALDLRGQVFKLRLQILDFAVAFLAGNVDVESWPS